LVLSLNYFKLEEVSINYKLTELTVLVLSLNYFKLEQVSINYQL